MSFLVMFFLPCFFQGSWEPLPKAPLHEMDVHLAANPSENLILRFGTGKLYYSSPAQSIWNGRDWVRSIPGVNLPSTEEPLLTYDPVNKGILLFGGARLGKNNYSFSNTTRLWKNGKWTTLRPKTSPSPRYVSSFTTDTKRNKIVFWAGGDSDFVRGRHYANQTWEWDGKDWKGILNPIFPTIRWRGTMGFDPVSGKCLLFGGTTGPFGVSVYLNDLWSWDGKVWREIKKTKGKPWPSVRGWTQRFVFHPKLQRLLLIGGMEKDSKSGWVFHSDTWAWDGKTGTWSLLHPDGSIKGFPQLIESVAIDPKSGNLVLVGRKAQLQFGGINWTNKTKHETWIHDGKTWKKVHRDPDFPGDLWDVTWDPKGDRYIGCNYVAWAKNGFGYFRFETWEYKPGVGWAKLSSSIFPKSFRTGDLNGIALLTHEDGGIPVFLATVHTTGYNFQKYFYKWDSLSSKWIRDTTVPPSIPTVKNRSCYDPKKKTLKVFGYDGTIWDWSPALGWKANLGTKVPKKVLSNWWEGGVTYDASRDRFVFVKKAQTITKVWNNWEWDRKKWTSIPGPYIPGGRGIQNFNLLYVPELKLVLLVGGDDNLGAIMNKERGNNTKTFSWDGKKWRILSWANYLDNPYKGTPERVPISVFFDRSRRQLLAFHKNTFNLSTYRLRIGGLISLPNYSRPGGSIPLEIREPSLPGQPFALGFSLASWPGLPFRDAGGQLRRLPLAADALFLQTFGWGTLGLLDNKGGAKLRLPIPSVPSLAGLDFYGAGIILNKRGVLKATNSVGLHVTR